MQSQRSSERGSETWIGCRDRYTVTTTIRVTVRVRGRGRVAVAVGIGVRVMMRRHAGLNIRH